MVFVNTPANPELGIRVHIACGILKTGESNIPSFCATVDPKTGISGLPTFFPMV